VAQVPRTHVRALGQRARAHGVRQPEDRRREAPTRGGVVLNDAYEALGENYVC
jgi:hypothetical protein